MGGEKKVQSRINVKKKNKRVFFLRCPSPEGVKKESYLFSCVLSFTTGQLVDELLQTSELFKQPGLRNGFPELQVKGARG